ncbi:hypothetical protein CEE44_00385 [Candidatus Woesearchaeota archaeon B3_Woes]|nr:MAG: hypothetical protein CEE44_00385 [Candidatus Woesearchaeota archaeon B3_Woes]
MKLRKTVKRIVALSTGATMLGATVLGAMAADLSEYPAPMFIKDGKFDGLLVIGADGDTQDMLGAMDMISSLQAVAVGGSTGTSAVTSTVGDVFKFDKSSDKLNVGENMTTIRTKLSDTHLPIILADGTFTTAKGAKYDYEQEISLGSTSDHHIQFFADKDYEDEKPVVGLSISRNKNVLNYTLEFTKNAKSSVNSDGDLTELEDRQIEMLGEVFDITGSENNTASTAELSLMRGALKPTLEEGETATYTIDGKEYEVTALIIDDTNSKVKFKINGEVTDSMVKGDVYQLSDGINIGAREILPNEAGDVTQDMVEFYLGAKKIVMKGGEELSMDDEDISNVDVYITTSQSASKTALEKIEIAWTADDDLFITEDGNEVVMPGLESIKFYMDGFYRGAEEEISVYGSSDDTITLAAPVKDYDVKLDLLYDSDSDGDFNNVGASATKKLITRTCLGTDEYFYVDMDTDEYFVVTKVNGKEAETAVLQLSKVHDTNGITVKDYTGTVIAENKKVTKTFDAADMTITVMNLSQTDSNVSFKLSDSNCVNSTLVTAEGLQLGLPATDVYTEYNLSNGIITANINCSGGDYSKSIHLNLTSWNATGTGLNGSKDCYAPAWTMNVTEEDKDENIASGTGFLQLNATFNSDTEAHVKLVAKTNLSNDKTYSIDNSKRYVGLVQSQVSTQVIEDKVADQYVIELTYPGEETYANLYIGSKASQVSTTAGSESVAITKIEVGAAVLDTSLSSYTNQNLIVVGGPAINRATAALTGKSYPAYGTDSGIPENAGLIKLVEQTDGTVAVIVAGWEADDTQRASRVLAESGNYALSGMEVVVTGTSLTDISVGVPAAE